MYIKNRQNSNEIMSFGLFQAWCFAESLVLVNRLLSIYETVSRH